MSTPDGHLPLPVTSAPVGVFDSGVGGLSVLREIRHALPAEDLLYVADSGHAPYGEQPTEFIEGRASAVVRFLLAEGVKAICVACNTATVVAVEKLRAWSPVPIVAIEPAIKPAAAATKTGVVGVLATSATLASPSVSRLVAQYGQDVRILREACPGFVEQVERAELDGAPVRTLVEAHVAPLLAAGADVLVLGCTHYPFLAPVIRAVAGEGVAVIDPAPAVARQLARQLEAHGIAAAESRQGSERFYSSGSLDHARFVMPRLWGRGIEVMPLPPA